MLFSKRFVLILCLCLVHKSFSKPTTENDLSEGRGFMSTIWSWISYPFTWWSSGEEVEPSTDKLIGSTTINPNDVIEIGSHNVTVWCNDQTCTTMKCDKTECRNVTCNIYDTDLRGECREYNMIPDVSDEHLTSSTTKEPVQNTTTESQKSTSSSTTTTTDRVVSVTEEHPLELEAVLSSTVNNSEITPEEIPQSKA